MEPAITSLGTHSYTRPTCQLTARCFVTQMGQARGPGSGRAGLCRLLAWAAHVYRQGHGADGVQDHPGGAAGPLRVPACRGVQHSRAGESQPHVAAQARAEGEGDAAFWRVSQRREGEGRPASAARGAGRLNSGSSIFSCGAMLYVRTLQLDHVFVCMYVCVFVCPSD